MIVQCPDCTTRYQLDPDRVPRERIRVRCPKCLYVFPIDGTLVDQVPSAEPGMDDSAASAAPIAEPQRPDVAAPRSGPTASENHPVEPTPVAEPQPEPAPVDSSAEPEFDDEPLSAPSAASPDASGPGFDLVIERGEAAMGRTVEKQVVEEESAAVATVEQPEEESPSAPVDPADKKARRLARALVSDILVYNREARDRALVEGNLVQALGAEIKKSWELYKERVTPDVANSTNHFRQALNDILADGQKIF